MVPGQRDTADRISCTLKDKASRVKDEELREHWWRRATGSISDLCEFPKKCTLKEEAFVPAKRAKFFEGSTFFFHSSPSSAIQKLHPGALCLSTQLMTQEEKYFSPIQHWGKLSVWAPITQSHAGQEVWGSFYPTAVVVYWMHGELRLEAQRRLEPCWWRDPWVRVDGSSHGRRGLQAHTHTRMHFTHGGLPLQLQKFLCAARNLGLQVAASPWCPGVRSERHWWNYKRTYPQGFESITL